jgi:hypothetical protein
MASKENKRTLPRGLHESLALNALGYILDVKRLKEERPSERIAHGR